MKHAYAETPLGQIYYESEGKGDAVLCLHQVAWSSREFVNLIPQLSKAYRVVAPDLLGYGLSGSAPAKFGKVEDSAGSVVQFLDAVGVKKASVIGSHAGAKVALELAAAYPTRVSKLVLYGCGIYGKNAGKTYDPKAPWTKQEQTTTLAERIALVKQQREMKAEVPVTGLHFYEKWTALLREDPEADAETIQDAFVASVRTYDKRTSDNSGTLSDLEYNVAKRGALVKCPALLVIGDEDIIRGPIYKAAEAVAKAMAKCKIAHVKEAGSLGISTAAAPVAKAMLAFLKGSSTR